MVPRRRSADTCTIVFPKRHSPAITPPFMIFRPGDACADCTAVQRRAPSTAVVHCRQRAQPRPGKPTPPEWAARRSPGQRTRTVGHVGGDPLYCGCRHVLRCADVAATLSRRYRSDIAATGAVPLMLVLSTICPTVAGEALQDRHVDLRPCVLSDGGRVTVLPAAHPGGSPVPASWSVDSSQGGTAEDMWVQQAPGGSAVRPRASTGPSSWGPLRACP